MLYSNTLDIDNLQPLSMMYGTRSPQVMMYNAKNMQPSSMLYSNTLDFDNLQPLSMMYNAKDLQPSPMMYRNNLGTGTLPIEITGKRSPQVMMYNAKDMQPSSMLYSNTLNIENLQPLSMMYRKRSPQMMIYNAKDMQPSAMLYSNLLDADKHQPMSMMYKKRSPQMMMYNANVMQPSSMLYSNTLNIDNLQPLSMMYGKRSPQMIMYDAKEMQPSGMLYSNSLDEDKHQPMSMMYKKRSPQVMMYNAKDMQPSVMRYSNTLDIDNHQLMSVLFEKRSPQVMAYKAVLIDKKPRHIMICAGTNVSVSTIERNEAANQNNQEVELSSFTNQWFKMAYTLVKEAPLEESKFFSTWKQTISIFGHDDLTRQYFKLKYPALSQETVIREISKSNVFEKLFWPFAYDIGFVNQKLGLLGFSGLVATAEKQKLMFYDILEKFQTLKIPVRSNKIVYSFNDSLVIDALNRSGLQEMSREYVDAGLHLYTLEEQAYIQGKVEAAMSLINDTMPELYKVITDRSVKGMVGNDESEPLICPLVNKDTTDNNNEELKKQMEENKDLQNTLKQFLSQSKILKCENEKLLNVLENTKRENEILRMKVIEQNDKCEKVESELSKLKHNLSKATAECLVLEESNEKLKKQNATLSKEKTQLADRLAKSTMKADSIESNRKLKV
jgi:hypothetical protein